MLEVDKTALEAITSAIDEAVSLIEERKDIRIVSAMLPRVSNRIRAMAELRDTPDNRFVAFLVQFFATDIGYRFEEQDEEWYRLNKEAVDQCLVQLKNLLTGLKSGLNAKSFEKTVDALKMFYFAYYQTALSMTA